MKLGATKWSRPFFFVNQRKCPGSTEGIRVAMEFHFITYRRGRWRSFVASKSGKIGVMNVSTTKARTIGLPFENELLASAVATLAGANTEDRGAVFTRREVADFILDLVEYWPSQKLQFMSLLEPSFGHGDFLIPAVERLMESLRNQKLKPTAELLKNSIRAVELHIESFEKTKGTLKKILQENGLDATQADTVLASWLIQGDFLLTAFEQKFTHVIGNPPYIRQEMVPRGVGVRPHFRD